MESNVIATWDTTATLPELAIADARPGPPRFARWIDTFALPRLRRELVARPEPEARFVIARSPFHLMASNSRGKLVIRAWETGPVYSWEWVRGTFDVVIQKEPEEVEGYIFGNVGLHRDGGWTLTHVPSGLGFGATWRTLDAAKAGTEAIHAAFHLARVDGYEKFTDAEMAGLQTLIKKHREYK